MLALGFSFGFFFTFRVRFFLLYTAYFVSHIYKIQKKGIKRASSGSIIGSTLESWVRSLFNTAFFFFAFLVHPYFSTENCIVFATTGHARFEHARVLNNKTRVIPGITVRRYRSRSIPRQLNHCITGIIHTFTASIPGMVGSSVNKYQNPLFAYC